ncbi:cupin domain-containing protein [Parenemella sanctibonifatiensis]|uniref:cupin domain-containing protein n=1 Tax=Parenemella sanctibonifatiensis TaxID=2016505 RepID=UPI001E5F5153|nr:cupin domain-containing protein [Parenemella sanctibonifatiensis]
MHDARTPLTGPGFPGGTGLSRLKVYDWPAPDGLVGGSPHLHTVSTEGYVVLSGQGRVQTITANDGFVEHALSPGTVRWFSPGTVHRLVNDSGDLELVVVMSNAGLPEHGDAVLTFPAEHLVSREAYQAAAALPDGDQATREAAARARRDLALAGYAEIREGGAEAYATFLSAAAALVADRTAEWAGLIDAGPGAQVDHSRAQLAALAAGDVNALTGGWVRSLEPKPALGMCGHLTTWDLIPRA